MESDALRSEMNGLTKTNLAGWRALGKKLLEEGLLQYPSRWKLFGDFMDQCPKAAADIRGQLRRKMVEAADVANPDRQDAHRTKVQTREAFSRKPNERKRIPDWVFGDI